VIQLYSAATIVIVIQNEVIVIQNIVIVIQTIVIVIQNIVIVIHGAQVTSCCLSIILINLLFNGIRFAVTQS